MATLLCVTVKDSVTVTRNTWVEVITQLILAGTTREVWTLLSGRQVGCPAFVLRFPGRLRQADRRLRAERRENSEEVISGL